MTEASPTPEERAYFEEMLTIFTEERQAVEARMLEWHWTTKDYYIMKLCDERIDTYRRLLGK